MKNSSFNRHIMTMKSHFIPIALLATSAMGAGAQQRPPIRQLGATVSKATETFTNITAVRPLSNGSVLVNDMGGRRVLLFNPQLSSFTIVADSTSATANAYGARSGGLIAYRGDSSLFVDPQSISMFVIDPAGKMGRVMSLPRAQDAIMLATPLGSPVIDGKGRLIYRASPSFQTRGPAPTPASASGPGAFPVPDIPDSAAIVRIDLATRKLDTLGFIKTPKIKMDVSRDENGGIHMTSQINPLPVVDDWAMTPDGAVALVRGRDYHIDWVNPDGTKVSAAKIPFDWQRMTDEDKVAFIDSVKAARARQGSNAPTAAVPGAPAPSPTPGAGGGGVNIQIFGGPGGPGGGPPTRTNMSMQQSFIAPSELPDYKPPFFFGSTRADTEGNLWIRTIPTSAIAGGPVYDVINRKGELVDRVQIPVNRTIIGFGPGGAVYLVNRDGTTVSLERATVK
jgi:hypothetical protein